MRNAKLEAAAPGGGGSRYTRVELALKSAEQLKLPPLRHFASMELKFHIPAFNN